MSHDIKDEWWLIPTDQLSTAGYLPPHAAVTPITQKPCVGETVELLFCRKTTRSDDETRAEYLWVEITDDEHDEYVGLLDNQPHYIRGLHHGATVRFGLHHIVSVLKRRPGTTR